MSSEFEGPKRLLNIYTSCFYIFLFITFLVGFKGKREGYFPARVQYNDGWVNVQLNPRGLSHAEGYAEVFTSPYFLYLQFIPNEKMKGTVRVLKAKLLDAKTGEVKETTIDDYDEFALDSLGKWKARFLFGGFWLDYIDYDLVVDFEIENKEGVKKDQVRLNFEKDNYEYRVHILSLLIPPA